MGDKDTITFSKDTIYGIVIAVLACLLVISVFTQGFGLVRQGTTQPSTNSTVQPPVQPPANTTGPSAVKVMELPQSLNLMPVMGPANSPVALLEFSDFQCSACGIAFGSPWTKQYPASETGVIPKLEINYVQTGKADFINIPVAFIGVQYGDNASIYAAEAALCAKDQGKYFDMYTAIFTAQDSSEGDGKYSKPNLEIIAQNVSGLNQTAFDACLAADTYVNQAEEFTSEWGNTYDANICQYHPGTATQSCGPGTPTIWILADASKTTQSKVSAAAAAAGFDWGLTSDNSTYVIIASRVYVQIQAVMRALE